MRKVTFPCRCGSGEQRYALKDAAGIFCEYVCEKCEAKTKKRWNPAIFDEGTSYALSGEEDQIGIEKDLAP